jgi:hypothetical protein
MRSNYHKLQALRTAKPKLRKAKIANCEGDLVKAISECAINVLAGNIPLKQCQKRALKKYKCRLRKVADRHESIKKKQRYIVQNGGFLLPLLGAVLPAVLPAISNWLFNRKS